MNVVRKSSDENNTSGNMQAEMQQSMRLFRAQRNFYIAGFSIFLVLVIRRLVLLISAQAQLLAQSEASMRQAQSATQAARELMKGDGDDAKPKASAPAKDDVETSNQTAELKKQVADLEQELKREVKDKEALKSQSESLAKEYDRLSDEFSKLQRKITISSKDD